MHNLNVVIVGSLTSKENTIAIAFTNISKKTFGNPIFGNTIAAGALSAALGINKRVLKNRFSKKANLLSKKSQGC